MNNFTTMDRSDNKEHSSFMVIHVDDLMIILVDLDQGGMSVTNDAYYVVKRLKRDYSLENRRIFYRDTMGRFDEIKTYRGIFTGFAPGSAGQQEFFKRLLKK